MSMKRTPEFEIRPDDLVAITAPEEVFGTTKNLPPMDSIPPEFLNGSNIYVRLVNAIFYGTERPDGEITFRPGFEQESVARCVRAHLASYSPKHEHKIAGVSYLLSLMAELEPRSHPSPKER